MKKRLPLISVIMPAYNAEEFLSTAIDSILNQTFGNFELLVINDGSSDGTIDIIKKYKDPRVKLINQEKNMGLVESLNNGLRNSSGDFIARMDADDIALPERFAIQLKYMNDNPECVVVGSQIECFGEKVQVSRYPNTDEQIRAALYFEVPICHPSSFIRTSVLKENNIQYKKLNEQSLLEDWALWVDIAKFGKMHNLDQILLKYRMGQQNTTTKNLDTRKKRVLDFYEKHLPDIYTEVLPINIQDHWYYHSLKYNGESFRELLQREFRVKSALVQAGLNSKAVEEFIDFKNQNAFYKIADKDWKTALRLDLKRKKLTFKKLRFAFSKLFSS